MELLEPKNRETHALYNRVFAKQFSLLLGKSFIYINIANSTHEHAGVLSCSMIAKVAMNG